MKLTSGVLVGWSLTLGDAQVKNASSGTASMQIGINE